MSIATQPDMYTPSINEHGVYIDNIPSYNIFSNGGVKCYCSTRKDKIYSTKAQFSAHTKTKTHKEWISKLNSEHMNYYAQSKIHENTIHNQKLIISQLEKKISIQDIIISTLTEKLHIKNTNDVVNLIDF